MLCERGKEEIDAKAFETKNGKSKKIKKDKGPRENVPVIYSEIEEAKKSTGFASKMKSL
jgi:hypothetical protein